MSRNQPSYGDGSASWEHRKVSSNQFPSSRYGRYYDESPLTDDQDDPSTASPALGGGTSAVQRSRTVATSNTSQNPFSRLVASGDIPKDHKLHRKPLPKLPEHSGLHRSNATALRGPRAHGHGSSRLEGSAGDASPNEQYQSNQRADIFYGHDEVRSRSAIHGGAASAAGPVSPPINSQKTMNSYACRQSWFENDDQAASGPSSAAPRLLRSQSANHSNYGNSRMDNGNKTYQHKGQYGHHNNMADNANHDWMRQRLNEKSSEEHIKVQHHTNVQQPSIVAGLARRSHRLLQGACGELVEEKAKMSFTDHVTRAQDQQHLRKQHQSQLHNEHVQHEQHLKYGQPRHAHHARHEEEAYTGTATVARHYGSGSAKLVDATRGWPSSGWR